MLVYIQGIFSDIGKCLYDKLEKMYTFKGIIRDI